MKRRNCRRLKCLISIWISSSVQWKCLVMTNANHFTTTMSLKLSPETCSNSSLTLKKSVTNLKNKKRKGEEWIGRAIILRLMKTENTRNLKIKMKNRLKRSLQRDSKRTMMTLWRAASRKSSSNSKSKDLRIKKLKNTKKCVCGDSNVTKQSENNLSNLPMINSVRRRQLSIPPN